MRVQALPRFRRGGCTALGRQRRLSHLASHAGVLSGEKQRIERSYDFVQVRCSSLRRLLACLVALHSWCHSRRSVARYLRLPSACFPAPAPAASTCRPPLARRFVPGLRHAATSSCCCSTPTSWTSLTSSSRWVVLLRSKCPAVLGLLDPYRLAGHLRRAQVGGLMFWCRISCSQHARVAFNEMVAHFTLGGVSLVRQVPCRRGVVADVLAQLHANCWLLPPGPAGHQLAARPR